MPNTKREPREAAAGLIVSRDCQRYHPSDVCDDNPRRSPVPNSSLYRRPLGPSITSWILNPPFRYQPIPSEDRPLKPTRCSPSPNFIVVLSASFPPLKDA